MHTHKKRQAVLFAWIWMWLHYIKTNIRGHLFSCGCNYFMLHKNKERLRFQSSKADKMAKKTQIIPWSLQGITHKGGNKPNKQRLERLCGITLSPTRYKVHVERFKEDLIQIEERKIADYYSIISNYKRLHSENKLLFSFSNSGAFCYSIFLLHMYFIWSFPVRLQVSTHCSSVWLCMRTYKHNKLFHQLQ